MRGVLEWALCGLFVVARIQQVKQGMGMFSGLDAELGQITAVDLGDETPGMQMLCRRYHVGRRRFVNLDAFEAGRRIEQHQHFQLGQVLWCIRHLTSRDDTRLPVYNLIVAGWPSFSIRRRFYLHECW
jgi:hypothetical protein